MSTIPHPKLSAKPETDYMLFHTALKAGQTMSLVSPPLIIAYHLIRKKPLSVRSFFWRMNLLAIGGTAVSVPIGAYMMKDESEVAMASKRERLVSTFPRYSCHHQLADGLPFAATVAQCELV